MFARVRVVCWRRVYEVKGQLEGLLHHIGDDAV